MTQCLRGPVRLGSMALIAGLIAGHPGLARAQDGDCVFSEGLVEAAQVTRCLGGLQDRVVVLEPGGEAAAAVDGKIEGLLATIGELQTTIASLEERVGDLQAHQPAIDFDLNREFDRNYETESDGLIIAFFTVKPDSGRTGTIQANLEGLVDEDTSTRGSNPTTTRASDSFLATVSSTKDRSATIVMPVRVGEAYRVNLSVSDESGELSDAQRRDESSFLSSIFFVSF